MTKRDKFMILFALVLIIVGTAGWMGLHLKVPKVPRSNPSFIAPSTLGWKFIHNKQTWTIAHWTTNSYSSWNLDWCDGYTWDENGKEFPIILTGPRNAPTGMKRGRRWIPYYWHNSATFIGMLYGGHNLVATNAVSLTRTNGFNHLGRKADYYCGGRNYGWWFGLFYYWF